MNPITKFFLGALGLAVSASGQCLQSTGGTLLGSGNDAVFANVPLGFPMPVPGSAAPGTWSHCVIGTNGWVALSNGSPAPFFSGVPSAGSLVDAQLMQIYSWSIHPRFAPFWGDLDVDPAFGGGIYVGSNNPGNDFFVRWQDVVEAGDSTTKTFEVVFHRDGRVRFNYSEGMNVETGASKFVAVSCANSVPVQPASDFLNYLVTTDVAAGHEEFGVGAFDLGGLSLEFSPATVGYAFSLPCGRAAFTSIGSGCYRMDDSIYQLFPDGAAAATALTGNALQLTPVPWPEVYEASWIAGTALSYYLQPTGATQLALGDDDAAEYQIPGAAFPAASGPVSTLRVHSNGVIALGAGPLDFLGQASWAPEASTLLDNPDDCIYTWSDLDPTTAVVSAHVQGNLICVTYEGVTHWGDPAYANTLQFQFDRATGQIRVLWLAVQGQSLSNSKTLIGWSFPGASSNPGSSQLAQTLPHRLGVATMRPLQLVTSPGAKPTPGAQNLYTIHRIPEAAPGSGIHFGAILLALDQLPGGVDLGFLGMPGCNLYVGGLVDMLTFVGTSADQSLVFPIPANAPHGVEFYLQAAALVVPGTLPGGLNDFGAVVSNGLKVHVGP